MGDTCFIMNENEVNHGLTPHFQLLDCTKVHLKTV